MKKIRTKVVTLVNTSTKKKFKSVAEAKKFIDNNIIKVDVDSDSNEILIEEQVISYKYTKVNNAINFSDDNKLAVLTMLKNAIKTHKIECNNVIFSIALQNPSPIKKFALVEILKDSFNFDDVKTNDLADKIINWKGSYKDKEIFYNNKKYYDFLESITFDKPKILLNILNHVQKNVNSLKFLSTKTNYKPCHSYGIEISENIYITLRDSDIMFGDSTTMGRNVSVTGIYNMVDNDINEMGKFLK
tara:strand:+ start:126 stop:860 length:735 start_codon:yes stop_codon:yes gene_type:complete